MSKKRVILYVDGGARGNPGPAGAGAYLTDENGECLDEIKEYLGVTTNNVAEYSALLLGLKAAAPLKPSHLLVRMDSQLVIRQLEGSYQVKQPHLKKLHREAQVLLSKFTQVHLEHIPRQDNQEADRLANEAMDHGLHG